ncbi:MAG: histidine kinase [Bacteroidetes bacterium]|nr:histidine kinase [Bacteroidota bacterium]|tara:strand:- start:481 stop:1683 length:1203 start_codon:yes stop_codon:yes gene_type:complete
MIVPSEYKDEKARQKELDSYSILDTLPEIDYDNLTAIAAEICGTSISLISLIDNQRQWFKSHHGYDSTETPREHAFCAHAINDPKNIFVIQDARLDERFHDNPLVIEDPKIIFYAGVPLVGEKGLPLGTLCVIDHKSKKLSQNQLRSLTALSNQVMNLLDLRKSKKLLEESFSNLEEKNQDLERFAYVAAHDLKSPLIGISGMAQIFSEEYGSKIDEEGKSMLELIKGASNKLRKLIDGLLEYSRCESVLNEKKSKIDLDTLKNEITKLFSYEPGLSIVLRSTITEIYANRTAIDQILINLVANAIKYNDKKITRIEIGVVENDNCYEFYVKDNGPGIEQEDQKKIFGIFEVLTAQDKFGQSGNGIGLATVKKIVERIGGSIKVESELGKGTKFIFTIEN